MKVALVGTGKMGTPIGERILAGGNALTVFSRTPGRADHLARLGAEVAHRLAGLLAAHPVCITMVSDDAAIEAVALGDEGLLAGASPGAILVDMSTISPAASARVAASADVAGVRYLRAPVSGNPTVVRAGNLTIVVSGPADALEEVRGLLEQIGPNVQHVGDAEQARVVKLALQVLIGGTAELLAEALVLAERGGVERGILLEVLGSSAVGSPFVKYKTGPLLADDYSATFTIEMMLKDVDLVLGFAREAGASLPLTAELRDLVAGTIEAGYGDADLMALYLALRERREA